MKQTLGQKLRELRDGRDLALRESARKLGGISAAHLSDIELGRRFPSAELLQQIARLYGVTVEELREYDTRAPVDELRRLAQEDPAWGFALRTIVEKQVSPEDIRSMTESKPDRDRE